MKNRNEPLQGQVNVEMENFVQVEEEIKKINIVRTEKVEI